MAMATGMARRVTKRRNRAAARGPAFWKSWDRKTLAWRGGVAALTLALAWFAFADAVANITAQTNPRIALAVRPGHAPALASLAARRLEGGDPAGVREAGRMAREALESAPIDARALRVFALAEEIAGRGAAVPAMMRLSERITRRDPATQLWLIEERIAANDLAGALRHYDTALRASRALDALLFPLLAGGLDDPAIRRAFIPYVKGAPPWLPRFLSSAVDQPAPTLADAMVAAGGFPPGEPYAALRSQLMLRLAQTGAVGPLLRLYATVPGADRRLLASTAFDKAGTDPAAAPVSWELMNTPSAAVAFEAAGQGSALIDVALAPNSNMVVARKLLALPPGTYAFAGSQSVGRWNGEARAFWDLACIRGGQSINIWRSPPLRAGAVRASPGPVVPAGCDGQYLQLVMAAGQGAEGVEMQVRGVTLAPLTP